MKSNRLALLATLAALAAACSGEGTAPSSTAAGTSSTTPATAPSTTTSTTTTTAATTTSTTTTTTSTTVPPTLSPLNGLPVDDPSLAVRRVIAVKVDNHPDARPQSGLQEADAVIETLIDGGITRFIALFHHSDSDYVGPIRSVRPTDSAMLAPLGSPFVQAGGMPWVLSLTTSRGVRLIGEGSAGLFRIPERRAPHNLYTNTYEVRRTADERGYDDAIDGPLYTVGEWEQPAAEAGVITLQWSDWYSVTWTYQDGKYLRASDGVADRWVDRTGAGEQLAFDVLVVIFGRFHWSPDPTGASDPLATTETVGSGRLLIFADGRVLEGTWEREEIADPFLLFDSTHYPVAVPTGIPWVSVFPRDRSVTWS